MLGSLLQGEVDGFFFPLPSSQISQIFSNFIILYFPPTSAGTVSLILYYWARPI